VAGLVLAVGEVAGGDLGQVQDRGEPGGGRRSAVRVEHPGGVADKGSAGRPGGVRPGWVTSAEDLGVQPEVQRVEPRRDAGREPFRPGYE